MGEATGDGDPFPTAIQSMNLQDTSPLDLADSTQHGLRYGCLETLQETLQLSAEEIANAVGISGRTLSRRRDEGTLTSGESDRLVRLAILFGEVAELFDGDREAARDWLKRPNRGLGHRSPLDAASTFIGTREVQKLIGRIEHGIYS